MHCTQCGAVGEGRFCASCGAVLKPSSCRACGSSVPAGTRFCTSCGTPAGGSGGGSGRPSQRRGADAGWWAAGGLLALVIVLVGVEAVRSMRAEAPESGAVPAAPLAGGAPPDLSAMTPREAADRLFNRVMSAAAQEDTAQANSFLPMAMDAYELARPLDDDGLFHLSLLQRAGGDYQGSLDTAVEGLRENPNHLLNLSSAAEASLQLGDVAGGREYYQRLVDSWDQELASGRSEYDEHAPLLPLIREDAEAFLGGGGGP